MEYTYNGIYIQWNIHTMEYTHNGLLLSHKKDGVLPFIPMWMNLETIILK